MGKEAAGDCGRHWRWREASDDVALKPKSWLATYIWPCASYSRTSRLLKAASSGQNGKRNAKCTCCDAKCIQFAMCLPFYGCFLSKLQSSVRTFYSIEGNACSDACEACCCPCLTLVRSEQEILLRENHKKVKGHHHHEASVKAGGGYSLVNPMMYLSPDISRSGQRKVLPAMGAAMTNDNVVRHKQQPHELSSHKLTAANSAAYPQVHYLDHHWYLVPVDDGTKKDNSKTLKSTIAKIVGKHSLEDHELVVTGSARTAHSLESDAKISHHGQRSSHQLHQDATTPIGNSSGDSPHMLCCDPVADEARAVVYHELQAHQPVESTRADHYHGLGQDVLVGTRGGAVTKHDIHADEVVKSHETEPPHLLADDGTVQSSSKSWAHAIDADKTAVTSQSGLGTHQLNAHRKVAKIDKGLTSHGLSKD